MPAAKDNKAPLPFTLQFSAGAIAGISEILTMYPLDVVKTRFQLQTGTAVAGGEGYTSVVDCFRKIVRQEGFGRLYRGIAAPIMVEAPKRAIKFAANEQYSNLYLGLLQQERMTQGLSVATGVSAGVTEAFVVVSFELVKIRMQDRASVRRRAVCRAGSPGALGGPVQEHAGLRADDPAGGGRAGLLQGAGGDAVAARPLERRLLWRDPRGARGAARGRLAAGPAAAQLCRGGRRRHLWDHAEHAL